MRCGSASRFHIVLPCNSICGLFFEFGHRLGARAAGGLVGGNHDAFHGIRLVQRINGDQHDRGRTIRIGNDALVLLRVLGVHLGDDQRHIGFHAERRRIVDHHRALFGRAVGKFLRPRRPRAEQRKIDALEHTGLEQFDARHPCP